MKSAHDSPYIRYTCHHLCMFNRVYDTRMGTAGNDHEPLFFDIESDSRVIVKRIMLLLAIDLEKHVGRTFFKISNPRYFSQKNSIPFQQWIGFLGFDNVDTGMICFCGCINGVKISAQVERVLGRGRPQLRTPSLNTFVCL